MKHAVRMNLGQLVSLLVLALAALLAGCALPQPRPEYSTTQRLVFPKVAVGPVLDGSAAADAIWNAGFKFSMEDGSPYPAAVFRGLYDANNVYIRVTVEDENYSDTDVVVVAFNPTHTATGYHRLHVFPCVLAQGGCSDDAASTSTNVLYSTGTGSGSPVTVAWGGTSTSPAGVQAFARTKKGAGNRSWEVQLRISRETYGFTDNNFFGLFVDVMRTDPNVGVIGEAVQYTWPPNLFIGSVDENSVLAELNSTLQPGVWGNATLSTLFNNGVMVDDLGTNHPTDPNKIVLGNGNVFHAQASNYTSSGGTLVKANAVRATFAIANNGLPSLGTWANVPVGGNPTLARDLAPTESFRFQTQTWNLTPAQITAYRDHPAQCIRVTLTSTDPATVFSNPTTSRNMLFVESSSPFREFAYVNPRGFEPPRGERTIDYTLRERFINFDPKLAWTSRIDNTTPLAPLLHRGVATLATELQLGITVEPPRVPLQKESFRVPAGTGTGRPAIKVAVRPGELLTLVGSGSVQLGGKSLTAAGGMVSDGHCDARECPLGNSRIGAVVASFDDFRESTFIIGNASTIKVPDNAQELSLRIYDPGRYGKQDGEGYTFELVRTRVEPWMLESNPALARPTRGADVFVALGANLPTWLLRGERDTGRVVRIGSQTFRVFENVGSFGYMVKTIR